MKVFFSLKLVHKKFKDLDDVFIFHEINDFCFFSESFHLEGCWDISYHSNTKSVKDYLSMVNTDTERQFIHDDEHFFDSIEEVDEYYRTNESKYTTSVTEFLNELRNVEFIIPFNKKQKHVVMLPETLGKDVSFTTIESLSKFLDKLEDNNISIDLIRVQINPYTASFDDYCNVIKRVNGILDIPKEATDSVSFNDFLNAIHSFIEVDNFINSKDEKPPKEKKKRIRQ